MFQKLLEDTSFSAITAGLVAVIVSYAGPLVIVFQAAKTAGLSDMQLATWIWAVSLGSGIAGLILSLRYRLPIITAFSTPGAALLIGALGIYSYQEAIFAFLVTGALILALGFSTGFQRLVLKMPPQIAAAMLAGILLQFGLQLIGSMQKTPHLVIPMAVVFLLGRRFYPTYAVIGALLIGLAISLIGGEVDTHTMQLAIVHPVMTWPTVSPEALVGIAIPLFVVAMASQNIPGLAVLEAAGYSRPPVTGILQTTGAVSVGLAPFGSHGITLAALTAAICTGPEAHKDPSKRYVAGVFCGIFYIIFGLLGPSVASLIQSLPVEFISATAGLALLSALTNGLTGALSNAEHREAAMIAFLVTASGIVVWGIGSGFWGLFAGLIALVTTRSRLSEVLRKGGRGARLP
ncbi:benzoate/H(+) symporter BenE family transporter [Thioclava sp. GXIMD4215]|uniref:benzoate/H(+) symporter BenE family transporter n=1 Tax=Thioclava sp. GXIMD4215 TaxID=3131928 RepID=UPI00324A9325